MGQGPARRQIERRPGQNWKIPVPMRMLVEMIEAIPVPAGVLVEMKETK